MNDWRRDRFRNTGAFYIVSPLKCRYYSGRPVIDLTIYLHQLIFVFISIKDHLWRAYTVLLWLEKNELVSSAQWHILQIKIILQGVDKSTMQSVPLECGGVVLVRSIVRSYYNVVMNNKLSARSTYTVFQDNLPGCCSSAIHSRAASTTINRTGKGERP